MEEFESDNEKGNIVTIADEEEEMEDEQDFVAELEENTFKINDKKVSELYNTKYSQKDYKECFPIEYLLDNEIPIYFNGAKQGPSFICLHGAGHSGLSFSMIAKQMKDQIRVFSYDARGHGFNKQADKDDLSKKTLINDFERVFKFLIEKEEFSDDTFIILGHSMGGSIANFAVEHIINTDKELAKRIQALIVIDVVEGTAMDALPFMENIVTSRPSSFKTIETFNEYMFKSNTIQCIESIRYSCPSLITKGKDNNYHWKTNLLNSKKYWSEWFEGLTQAFLSVRIPKLLLLAGTERLDKELTIAHMQGKFKLLVLSNVGHFMHEDNPKNTAISLIDFVKVFRIPDKVSKIKPIVGKIGGNSSLNV